MSFRKALLVVFGLAMTFGTSLAFANEGGAASDPYASLAAAFAIGLAAFGGAFAQAKTASSALDGIARNPAAEGKIRTPMIIALALIESLVLYAFVIAFIKIKI
jgi:F-type H+-transporting ATPase subunit c